MTNVERKVKDDIKTAVSDSNRQLLVDTQSKLAKSFLFYRRMIDETLRTRSKYSGQYRLIQDDQIAKLNQDLQIRMAVANANFAAQSSHRPESDDGDESDAYGYDISLKKIKANVDGNRPRRKSGATTKQSNVKGTLPKKNKPKLHQKK